MKESSLTLHKFHLLLAGSQITRREEQVNTYITLKIGANGCEFEMSKLSLTAGLVEGSIYESTTWKYNLSLCNDVYSMKIRLKLKKSFSSSSIK